MNRCTQLDEILHDLDNRTNLIEYQGHRSKVKVAWVVCVFLCAWCCGYLRIVLSLEQGLMILFCSWKWWRRRETFSDGISTAESVDVVSFAAGHSSRIRILTNFKSFKKSRIFANFKRWNIFYTFEFWHIKEVHFTKCKLKLQWSPYHHSGTNSCRLSAVKVGLLSQVHLLLLHVN